MAKKKKLLLKLRVLAVAALAVMAQGSQADEAGSRWSDGIGLYVGVDSRSTIIGGTFADRANPNLGRLTLLFDHGDHFHGIGTYSYGGTAQAPQVLSTNGNNRLPELYSRKNEATRALRLQAGQGAFAGQWVSQVLPTGSPAADYSYLGMASIHSLAGLSPQADELFASSGNRWNAAHSGVKLGLKLESATAGLKVAAGGTQDIFAHSAVYALGGSQDFSFVPTFYVQQGAAAATYTAQFSLVNLGDNSEVQNSGSYFIDFAVPTTPVPEPQTWALLAAGLLAVSGLAKRRRPG